MIARLKAFVVRIPLLRTVLQLVRRLWRDRFALPDIIRDIRDTRRQMTFVRDSDTPANGRAFLILAVDDGAIYQLKLLAMLATGLLLKGWKPVVVFRNRSCVLGRAYFKAFGIDDFVYLDDVRLAAKESRNCIGIARTMMEGSIDLQKVKTWRFQESWIGPQMISTLSRLRFEGMPDFEDPSLRRMLADVLSGTLEHVLRAKGLLARVPAELALVVEANYSIFGPLVDVCIARGTNVVQLIQPWKDDALILKRLTAATRREHPASVDRITLDRIAQQTWTSAREDELNRVFEDRYSGKWFLQTRNQRNTKRSNRTQLVNKLDLNPAKKIAVVFSHVLWDANLFYGEDLFKDYGEWFVRTVSAACTNPNLNWLIKIHPANVWKRAYENVSVEYAELALIRDHIGDLPPHVKIIPANTDISTYSLFESVDFGVTVRGTAGFELPCFGKACITAGTGRYSGLGFTADSNSSEEYLSKLGRLQEIPQLTKEQVQRAKWHAYAVFVLRPWSMKSARSEFSYKQKGQHPLDHNLRFVARSIAEIGKNGDLDAWAAWAPGREVDYIADGN